jgi:hypothetical protein
MHSEINDMHVEPSIGGQLSRPEGPRSDVTRTIDNLFSVLTFGASFVSEVLAFLRIATESGAGAPFIGAWLLRFMPGLKDQHFKMFMNGE